MFDFILNLKSNVKRICNSTVPSGPDHALTIEFPIDEASQETLRHVFDKGLMLVAGEMLRATVQHKKNGDANDSYDPAMFDILEQTREEIVGGKQVVIELDKYMAWITSRKKKALTEEEKYDKDLVETAKRSVALGKDTAQVIAEVKALMESIQS
jgi:hypothetical protein